MTGPLIEFIYKITKDSALDIFNFFFFFLETRTEYRPVHSAIYSMGDKLGNAKAG